MDSIVKKIEEAFKQDKIYLDNKLTVDSLASKLNLKSHHISQTFSQVVKENFNDYTNRHRIEYSKLLMHNPAYSNFKIEAIALDSGFNNKVTFYKAFSKFSNTTPSKYRNSKE